MTRTGLLTIYGIKNCDTVKKACRWLEENGIEARLYDYRANGLDETLLQQLIDKQGWQNLLNTRGTTWRKLDQSVRLSCNNPAAAKAVMLANPSVIKRPLLLAASGQSLLGFQPESYVQFIAEIK